MSALHSRCFHQYLCIIYPWTCIQIPNGALHLYLCTKYSQKLWESAIGFLYLIFMNNIYYKSILKESRLLLIFITKLWCSCIFSFSQSVFEALCTDIRWKICFRYFCISLNYFDPLSFPKSRKYDQFSTGFYPHTLTENILWSCTNEKIINSNKLDLNEYMSFNFRKW